MNVLIISNNCMSNSGAAGRTLQYLFSNSCDYNLHQFYVSNEIPDQGMCCKSFFRITNKDIINAFIPKHSVGGTIEPNSSLINCKNVRKGRKTVFTSLARNFVWNLGFWKSNTFKKWLDTVSPEVIFLLNTDAEFLINIALYVSKKFDCPIILYNTERYYFNDECYMYLSRGSKLLYPIWLRRYRKTFEKLMNSVFHCIYNTPALEQRYKAKFPHNSSVVYAATDVKPIKKSIISEHPRLVYMGNLGLGRYQSLIELGKAVKEVDSEAELDVFGNANQQCIIDKLNSSDVLSYKGNVPYQEVIEKMHRYDFLVHTESFEDGFVNGVKYGFSTKIADCLASGTCLIAYADESIAFMKYLKEIGGACLITSKDMLTERLSFIFHNSAAREKIIENAVYFAEKNHRRNENAKRVFQLLSEAVNKNR